MTRFRGQISRRLTLRDRDSSMPAMVDSGIVNGLDRRTFLASRLGMATVLTRDVWAAASASPTFHKRGMRHVTTFPVYVDADYAKKYGDPSFIADYGNGLLRHGTSGKPK